MSYKSLKRINSIEVHICTCPNEVHMYVMFSRNMITQYNIIHTPGTAGGPGGRDRTLAVKSKKIARKSPFFLGGKKITQKTYFCFAYIF